MTKATQLLLAAAAACACAGALAAGPAPVEGGEATGLTFEPWTDAAAQQVAAPKPSAWRPSASVAAQQSPDNQSAAIESVFTPETYEGGMSAVEMPRRSSGDTHAHLQN